MSPVLQIIMALGSVVILVAMMAIVRHLARIWQISAEVQRKLVHIGTGLYALTLPWLFPDRWPIYFLIGLTLLVMLILRLPNSKLGETLHGVERKSYGDFLLAISIGLCLFFAKDQMFLYVLPIAVLTLADAAAALAGTSYGTRFFRVEEGQKSLEGSVVFFVVTLLISIICLMVMSPFAPPNIIVISLIVAAFGTLVEAQSWRGFDNLFLPMGLLIFLSAHAANSLSELVFLAALFTICTVAFRLLAPKFGLSAQAARVYVITVFLLLSVTAVQNALVPMLILAAHAWSRSAAPCDSKLPNLDIVAGLALVSFGWVGLGNAIGVNAVSFYGLTVTGMVIGLCAIALEPKSWSIRILALSAIATALCGIRVMVISLNPDNTNWNGPMWPAVVVSLALSSLVPLILPQAFARRRVAKLTFLSLVMPLTYYLFLINFAGALA